jgi:hypothetical protein
MHLNNLNSDAFALLRLLTFLLGLRQRYLETVVPKIPEATVLVLAGEFAGQRARLMEVRWSSTVHLG